ncbi:hypothetical protein Cgig2_023898 [Carnegiea gigantea]|uniref:Reverse transcriptase zinc-binding domain-containing protein n=1 Tax=Carnegiea gigantea TaxID=171969 RepID=A0A9Q1GQ14_9CARY|nr:hypothetical protein Cgig2_023898 [Carnegiea gigantea]
MRWSGAYYSWANKTIRSRIDRAIINIYWYEVFDFTQNQYLANGLSDHTPMLVQFLTLAKPRSIFQFCEIWCMHQNFNKIVDSVISLTSSSPLSQLRSVMANLRSHLSELNRDNFADLRAQQEKAREELTNLQMQLQESPGNTSLIQVEKDLKSKYSDILSSSMALMQQQCKIEWIHYGDDNTRIFFAKAKQRKLASYIYKIKDAKGDLVQGFDQVGLTMQTFYKALQGEQNTTKQMVHMEVAHQGPVLRCKEFTNLEIKEAIFSIPNFKSPGPSRFNNGFYKVTWQELGPLYFPLTYFGVPITASHLTKIECASLVEKIIARVHLWAARNISFVGRVRLINSTIFGMYSYWASIFRLPNKVTEKIIKICRNYLWSETGDYKKVPYISGHHTCLPKSHGGIGIKDFAAWNKATIAKLTWAVARKKEVVIQHSLPTKQRLSKHLPPLDNLCVLCSAEEEEEAHLFYNCSYAKIIWNELRKWW